MPIDNTKTGLTFAGILSAVNAQDRPKLDEPSGYVFFGVMGLLALGAVVGLAVVLFLMAKKKCNQCIERRREHTVDASKDLAFIEFQKTKKETIV